MDSLLGCVEAGSAGPRRRRARGFGTLSLAIVIQHRARRSAVASHSRHLRLAPPDRPNTTGGNLRSISEVTFQLAVDTPACTPCRATSLPSIFCSNKSTGQSLRNPQANAARRDRARRRLAAHALAAAVLHKVHEARTSRLDAPARQRHLLSLLSRRVGRILPQLRHVRRVPNQRQPPDCSLPVRALPLALFRFGP